MSPENVKRLHQKIVEQGTKLQPLLPPLASHPNGRNGIAHIYSVIKQVMGVPMKECRDCRYCDIDSIIHLCVHIFEGKLDIDVNVFKNFEKEPWYEPATLEKFL
jgi:hypothetical protein